MTGENPILSFLNMGKTIINKTKENKKGAMRQYLFSPISLLGLIVGAMVAGTGCQKDYRFFEAPADSIAVPATINAGEDLQVILCGSLDEYTPEPTIDRIEYKVSAYLIDIKVIIKEPIGAIAVPASWPWVDTVYVKNLTLGRYEIKNGSLRDTVDVVGTEE